MPLSLRIYLRQPTETPKHDNNITIIYNKLKLTRIKGGDSNNPSTLDTPVCSPKPVNIIRSDHYCFSCSKYFIDKRTSD